MADVVITKIPAATFDYDMEFSDLLPSGAAIVTKTVTATDSAGTDSASTVTPASSVSGTKVRINLAAGTAWEDYLITALATTTDDVFARTLELRVRTDPIEGTNKV